LPSPSVATAVTSGEGSFRADVPCIIEPFPDPRPGEFQSGTTKAEFH
jgi:hypothetical protein